MKARLLDQADHLFPWLILSTIVNGFLVLGISLSHAQEKKTPPPPNNIEVVLSESSQHEKRPAAAELLSQHNHQGQGDSHELPTTNDTLPADSAHQADADRSRTTPQATLYQHDNRASNSIPPAHPAENGPDSEFRISSPAMPVQDRAKSSDVTHLAALNPANLRAKVIDSSTRAHRYAAYMDGWRRKVERIGNRYYPDDIRSQGLQGSLILDVALFPDGNIQGIEVQKSSGIPLLDEAARKIVRMAAPYQPFPEQIRKETDVLHIVRTWNFSNNQLQ